MTTDDIKAKAKRQAAGGLDARTIVVDLELQLKRQLTPAEAQAMQDGFREAYQVRQKAQAARDREAAQEARRAAGL